MAEIRLAEKRVAGSLAQTKVLLRPVRFSDCIPATMRTRKFRDLLVWQDSMTLARNVYALTAEFPQRETFGLGSQLCRAAVSIPSNIAEGHGRLSDKAFAVFLGNARGSLFELETQLEIAGSLNYIPSERLQSLLRDCEKITRMLNALLAKLRKENG
jgi:four helix bundle protein